MASCLVKRLNPSDANRSVVESIIRESDRLQELLKQLDAAVDLDLADLVPLLPAGESAAAPDVMRSAAPKLLLGSAIDLQPCAIVEVLQPLLDSAGAIAQDRRLALETKISPSLPPVWLDRRALREVANNLIDNALKYTPAGGQIYVAVQRLAPAATGLPQRQVILVADTGPGIPPADLAHLFTRHYRGVQAQTNIPGTGSGASNCPSADPPDAGRDPALSVRPLDCGLLDAYSAFEQAGTAAVVWLTEAVSSATP